MDSFPIYIENKISQYFQGHSENITNFKKNVLQNKSLCDILMLIVEEKFSSTVMNKTVEDYKDNAWAYKAAHRQGQRQSLQELIEILTALNNFKYTEEKDSNDK